MPMFRMPKSDTPKSGMPSGALAMLILRVLHSGPLHGYAIAQRIHVLSSEVLEVEEGSQKQLETELEDYARVTEAIQSVLRTA